MGGRSEGGVVSATRGVLLAALFVLVLVGTGGSPASAATAGLASLPSAAAFGGNPCVAPPDAGTCEDWNSCAKLLSCTGDAPDPAIIRMKDQYWAFTTGTALGNSIQVLVSSTPTGGYHGWYQVQCRRPGQWTTFACPARWGSSAFGTDGATGLPPWTSRGEQTSPSPLLIGGRLLMYYDAIRDATHHYCLAVAQLRPRDLAADGSMKAPEFIPAYGSQGPLACDPPSGYAQGVGLIDPEPFVDPATHTPWLLYKSNEGNSPQPAFLFIQQLSPDGLHLVGPAHELLTNDTVHHPWEATVENPSMVKVAGGYRLVFSAGLWYRDDYNEAVASCASVTGPCTQPDAPFLRSYGRQSGPAGGSVFTDSNPAATRYLVWAAWDRSCVGYTYGYGAVPAGCSTGARRLFVARLSLP